MSPPLLKMHGRCKKSPSRGGESLSNRTLATRPERVAEATRLPALIDGDGEGNGIDQIRSPPHTLETLHLDRLPRGCFAAIDAEGELPVLRRDVCDALRDG